MRWLAAVVLVVAAGCASWQPVKPYRKHADQPYGPDPAHRYDFYEPIDLYAKHEHNRPVLFAIHGGSWVMGDKSWGKRVAERFCPEGYCVVSVNYRLAPTHVWPAQLDDVQACLAHVISATWLDVNTARLAVVGHSAGAMLASHLAFRGDGSTVPYVRVAVLLAGHFAYDEVRDLDTHVARLFDVSPDALPADGLRDISSTHLARREVTALFLHPSADPIASVEHSKRLYAAMLRAGSQGTDAKWIPSGDHNDFWLKDGEDHVREILRFLDRNL
jgi:acetyl esterase/lipase